jgi:hypothetical protein
MRRLPQNQRRLALLRKVTIMTRDVTAQKKRESIQRHFWLIVGNEEHINLPKLEDAIQKEFSCRDDRFVELQVRLMQTEGRVRVQAKSKVWLKQPPPAALAL